MMYELFGLGDPDKASKKKHKKPKNDQQPTTQQDPPADNNQPAPAPQPAPDNNPAPAPTTPAPAPEPAPQPAPAPQQNPTQQDPPADNNQPAPTPAPVGTPTDNPPATTDDNAAPTQPYAPATQVSLGAPVVPNVHATKMVKDKEDDIMDMKRKEMLEQNFDKCTLLGRAIYEFNHGDPMSPELELWLRNTLTLNPELAAEAVSANLSDMLEANEGLIDVVEDITYSVKSAPHYSAAFIEIIGDPASRTEFKGPDALVRAQEVWRAKYASLKFEQVFTVTWYPIMEDGELGDQRVPEAEVRSWIISLCPPADKAKKEIQAQAYKDLCLAPPENNNRKGNNGQQNGKKQGNKPAPKPAQPADNGGDDAGDGDAADNS